MKLWQIKNILSDEIEIYNNHFLSFQNYQEEIPAKLVIEALEKSRKIFIVTDKGYLRLNLPNDKSSKVIGNLSVVEAYKKYGSNAINEVIDYGSFNVGTDRESQA
ncbi:MAG: hypothetical protein IM606_05955 [Cytophagales bacterium]|jgi:hypothetical protein|nr:hypothetical protein [Cytophagales bacterium]MCA6389648.1 hypothetical protein [Cytophagales bacterium]MCA6390414.1 hypothetical protein [Cytophagales bacterium]MCA6394714.1 hypothetical protein [Cytophagales bacterium]MCA6403589.1 hypothetical protein [Cytophagales bacterium]